MHNKFVLLSLGIHINTVYKNKKYATCNTFQIPQLYILSMNYQYNWTLAGGCNNIYWLLGRPPFGTGVLMIISLRPTDFDSNLPTPNLAILDATKCWCQCSLLLAQCSMLPYYIGSYLPQPEYPQRKTHLMLTKLLTFSMKTTKRPPKYSHSSRWRFPLIYPFHSICYCILPNKVSMLLSFVLMIYSWFPIWYHKYWAFHACIYTLCVYQLCVIKCSQGLISQKT